MKKYKDVIFNFILIIYLLIVFVVSCIIATRVFSQGTEDLTAEMSAPNLPVISIDVGEHSVNYLYGYTDPMDCAFMRDNLTVIGKERQIKYSIDTYGNTIDDLAFEIRSINGDRLVENNSLYNYSSMGDKIKGSITVKDLIEEDKEYMLVFILDVNGKTARYYSRLLWSEKCHVEEKVSFVYDFCTKTFDKEAAAELTKYLESNSSGDNSSFHKMNIHSSFKQVTWGDLKIKLIGEPRIDIKELTSSTGYFEVNYQVQIEEESGWATCNVKEYYRIRYTSERIYLLDWERECNQIIDEKNDIYVDDQIELGISDENIEIVESDGGNIFAFVDEGKLVSINADEEKIALLFSFYTDDLTDLRGSNPNHDIHILNVDETGNVTFVVYGYMNRGIHEGKVGVSVYKYNSVTNTIEEIAYVGSDKAASILRKDVSELAYVDREGNTYFMQGRTVYAIDAEGSKLQVMASDLQDSSYKVSDSGRMIVWQSDGNIYSSSKLRLMNLTSGISEDIKAGYGEFIMPLGFMNEDLVYGLARIKDISEDLGGETIFPMYKLIIRSDSGEILKEYSEPDTYVMDCEIVDGQMKLSRAKYNESKGYYEETSSDQIMSTFEQLTKHNIIKPVVTEELETIMQISMKNSLEGASIIYQTPQEILYEGSKELERDVVNERECFYVYGLHGYSDCFFEANNAVNYAYNIAGVVMDNNGEYVWYKTTRVSKNQIMAITEPEKVSGELSIAECIDALLRFEGVTTNSRVLLAQGQNAREILETNLPDHTVLNLSGCNLDSILYYVNKDIPVMVVMNDSSGMLITGFNESQVVLFDPEKGELHKENMTDVDNLLRENGYRFLTYIR